MPPPQTISGRDITFCVIRPSVRPSVRPLCVELFRVMEYWVEWFQ